VIPQVESRIAAGRIAEAPPLQLYQFRFLQGDGKNIVEISERLLTAATKPPPTSNSILSDSTK
jgi:hypothetical protein